MIILFCCWKSPQVAPQSSSISTGSCSCLCCCLSVFRYFRDMKFANSEKSKIRRFPRLFPSRVLALKVNALVPSDDFVASRYNCKVGKISSFISGCFRELFFHIIFCFFFLLKIQWNFPHCRKIRLKKERKEKVLYSSQSRERRFSLKTECNFFSRGGAHFSRVAMFTRLSVSIFAHSGVRNVRITRKNGRKINLCYTRRLFTNIDRFDLW